MSKEIAKSPEILAKEVLIKNLQTKLKKKKTSLKSLKTRLKNTKNEITDIQRAGSGQMMSKMAQMDKLRLEIVELVQQMKKLKGLSRADKAALKDMEKEFASEDMFGEGFKAHKAQMDDMEQEDFEAHFDENERARMRDVFETFAVKPDKEEQKDIRKIFISLSQKFHPDKATTKADEEEYHQMMQQINEAYQAGDIQTLLELEQLFLTENLDLSKAQSWTVDVLDQAIKRLERDVKFIESQITRNSLELKQLRTSELGQMLTDMKRAEKQGAGMNAAIAQLDESINRLTELRDAFSESIKLGNISPLNELMMAEVPSQPSPEDMMEMLDGLMSGKMDINDLANMFGMDDDDDDFFGFDDDDDETPENAKFKEGDSVKIAKKVIDEETAIDLSGLIGRVEDVYYGYDEEIVYEIELDSRSLDKLPPSYIEEMVRIEEDFQNFELEENQLTKCKARERKEATKGAYRKKLHQYLWNYLDDATQKRLHTILLQSPDLLDWENWHIFLEKQLKFPIAVKSRGMMEFRRGEKLKITGLSGYNEEVGLIVDVTYRNRPGNYPLFDLIPTAKNAKLKQIFDDYLVWTEEMHEF
ncbi:MAG: DnaJ family molecular chaperone [Saprospiraceae bacterium]